jgi:FixJ family two-component response regulator
MAISHGAGNLSERERAPVSAEPSSPHPTLITVVDDENSVLESLAELLEALGFSVRTFSSAESFLASDALERTGCLLLDVEMPGMTGPELLRVLDTRGLRIPVVIITAHDEALTSVLSAGARDCLIKPFSEAALEGAIREALHP